MRCPTPFLINYDSPAAYGGAGLLAGDAERNRYLNQLSMQQSELQMRKQAQDSEIAQRNQQMELAQRQQKFEEDKAVAQWKQQKAYQEGILDWRNQAVQAGVDKNTYSNDTRYDIAGMNNDTRTQIATMADQSKRAAMSMRDDQFQQTFGVKKEQVQALEDHYENMDANSKAAVDQRYRDSLQRAKNQADVITAHQQRWKDIVDIANMNAQNRTNIANTNAQNRANATNVGAANYSTYEERTRDAQRLAILEKSKQGNSDEANQIRTRLAHPVVPLPVQTQATPTPTPVMPASVVTPQLPIPSASGVYTRPGYVPTSYPNSAQLSEANLRRSLAPPAHGTKLDPNIHASILQSYYRLAHGDIATAKAMAQQDGWTL